VTFFQVTHARHGDGRGREPATPEVPETKGVSALDAKVDGASVPAAGQDLIYRVAAPQAYRKRGTPGMDLGS
jgi:hypothetical protein